MQIKLGSTRSTLRGTIDLMILMKLCDSVSSPDFSAGQQVVSRRQHGSLGPWVCEEQHRQAAMLPGQGIDPFLLQLLLAVRQEIQPWAVLRGAQEEHEAAHGRQEAVGVDFAHASATQRPQKLKNRSSRFWVGPKLAVIIVASSAAIKGIQWAVAARVPPAGYENAG